VGGGIRGRSLSDFESFALGFASGSDLDLPISFLGNAFTLGQYFGYAARSFVDGSSVGAGRSGGGGSRFQVASGVNLSKSGGPSGGGLSLRSIVEDRTGENLNGVEFFIHGTTADVARNFKLLPGRRLFTTTDPAVARLFAERTVAKAGRGEVGGVVIALPRRAVDQLRALGQLTVKPIDDMRGKIEFIFQPGAYEIIRQQGDIISLPPGTL
jgi:hypothetical protein